MIRLGSLRDTVTVYSRSDSNSDTDRYGNAVSLEADGVDVRASISPMDALEDEILRDTRVTRYHAVLPPDAPVDALSRVYWNGDTYEVIGSPLLATGRSGAHHLTAVLRRIEG